MFWLPCRILAQKDKHILLLEKNLMNLRKGSLKCNLLAETGVPGVINPRGPSQFCMSLFFPEAKGEK